MAYNRNMRIITRPLTLILLSMLLAACNMPGFSTEPTLTPTNAPTEVAQVTSPTDAPTVVAEETLEPGVIPTRTSTPEFELAVATPTCGGAPIQRLIVQERGMVTENGRDLNVRPEAGTSNDNDPLGKLDEGEVFFVLEGPICSGSYAWFKIRSTRFEGWIAEGDNVEYYTAPYLPG